ncbi:uncharacterized protein SPPG_06408 [Spizellomyces punctatus DAOM BR117]|uniref:Uncharacterized protein n=1 Tax=Spizellomyces punctatus (strain DAOM BR117) TaxID=645134 RepID=A0A0L0HAX0_SPIPD|nr:uncharacterized protein SPPG_06408 [Spizellomyces punctatus DAOM BR117]KNC98730.1 hypothetical protein SPPG_06408 [Spizellomyces punctatus DAOM BR117]|eukprot:XP_016606770.1 hypothetical protein SPPG_06408 [Spizellomyces punctatus DAOM BR117]
MDSHRVELGDSNESVSVIDDADVLDDQGSGRRHGKHGGPEGTSRDGHQNEHEMHSRAKVGWDDKGHERYTHEENSRDIDFDDKAMGEHEDGIDEDEDEDKIKDTVPKEFKSADANQEEETGIEDTSDLDVPAPKLLRIVDSRELLFLERHRALELEEAEDEDDEWQVEEDVEVEDMGEGLEESEPSSDSQDVEDDELEQTSSEQDDENDHDRFRVHHLHEDATTETDGEHFTSESEMDGNKADDEDQMLSSAFQSDSSSLNQGNPRAHSSESMDRLASSMSDLSENSESVSLKDLSEADIKCADVAPEGQESCTDDGDVDDEDRSSSITNDENHEFDESSLADEEDHPVGNDLEAHSASRLNSDDKSGDMGNYIDGQETCEDIIDTGVGPDYPQDLGQDNVGEPLHSISDQEKAVESSIITTSMTIPLTSELQMPAHHEETQQSSDKHLEDNSCENCQDIDDMNNIVNIADSQMEKGANQEKLEGGRSDALDINESENEPSSTSEDASQNDAHGMDTFAIRHTNQELNSSEIVPDSHEPVMTRIIAMTDDSGLTEGDAELQTGEDAEELVIHENRPARIAVTGSRPHEVEAKAGESASPLSSHSERGEPTQVNHGLVIVAPTVIGGPKDRLDTNDDVEGLLASSKTCSTGHGIPSVEQVSNRQVGDGLDLVPQSNSGPAPLLVENDASQNDQVVEKQDKQPTLCRNQNSSDEDSIEQMDPRTAHSNKRHEDINAVAQQSLHQDDDVDGDRATEGAAGYVEVHITRSVAGENADLEGSKNLTADAYITQAPKKSEPPALEIDVLDMALIQAQLRESTVTADSMTTTSASSTNSTIAQLTYQIQTAVQTYSVTETHLHAIQAEHHSLLSTFTSLQADVINALGHATTLLSRIQQQRLANAEARDALESIRRQIVDEKHSRDKMGSALMEVRQALAKRKPLTETAVNKSAGTGGSSSGDVTIKRPLEDKLRAAEATMQEQVRWRREKADRIAHLSTLTRAAWEASDRDASEGDMSEEIRHIRTEIEQRLLERTSWVESFARQWKDFEARRVSVAERWKEHEG